MSHSEKFLRQWPPSVVRTKFPEYRTSTEIQIEHFLGYLPAPDVYAPFEPYLNELIHQKKIGMLNKTLFDEYAEQHIRLIRNEEVKEHTLSDYKRSSYVQYRLEYRSYGEQARDRIVRILGYEPDLSRSLFAELFLRELMRKDKIFLPEELTPLDFKLIGLIRYREALLTYGKVAADNLPCLKCEPDWIGRD